MHVRLPARSSLVALWVLASAGCAGTQRHGDGGGIAIQTGYVVAPMTTGSDGTMEDGVEVRAFGGFASDDPAIPNAYSFALRDVGGDLQYAAQWGWAGATKLDGAAAYGRIMFDVIEHDEIAHADSLSAFSPTIDAGVAPFGHGICVSASATYDVHFDGPDRFLFGGFVGLCGGSVR